MPVERDGLRHVLTGIVIGVERCLRGRAEPLARLRVLRKAVGCRRVRDREIISVAAAHADGAERAAHLLLLLLRLAGREQAAAAVAAEETIEEAALLALQRRGAILRTAIVLPERDQQRLALRRALRSAALHLLELHLQPVERGARLVDLPRERAALRGRFAKDREEAGALAVHAARLRHQA